MRWSSRKPRDAGADLHPKQAEDVSLPGALMLTARPWQLVISGAGLNGILTDVGVLVNYTR